MSSAICHICKEYNAEINWVIQLNDERGNVKIEGHKNCIDECWLKVKQIKDLHKKSNKKVLEELNITL